MPTTVVFEGQVEVPLTLRSLADFRRDTHDMPAFDLEARE